MLPAEETFHIPTHLLDINYQESKRNKKSNKLTCVRLLGGRLLSGLSCTDAASRAKRVRSSLSVRAC